LPSFKAGEGTKAAILENNCLLETPSSLSGLRSGLKVKSLLEISQLSTRSGMGQILALQDRSLHMQP